MSNSDLIPNPMNFSITIRGSLSVQKAYYVVCHDHFGEELYNKLHESYPNRVDRVFLNGVKILDNLSTDYPQNTAEIHGDKDTSHLYGENGNPLPCQICTEMLMQGYTIYGTYPN